MIHVDISATKFDTLASFIDSGGMNSKLTQLIPFYDCFTESRIRIGNEFCERLLPSIGDLRKTVELADRLHLSPVVALANLTDRGQDKACRLLSILSGSVDVIANDWGTAALIAESFPRHSLIAGRLLCKHLKEARIARPKEPTPANWPTNSSYFVQVLKSLSITRAEVDLAPHTRVPETRVSEIALTLHLGRGYSAKSHVCRIGSTHLANDKKFVPGHLCRRECLDYETEISKLRYPKESGLRKFQRGNTWFYHYTDEMNASVVAAFQRGLIDRAVVTLD